MSRNNNLSNIELPPGVLKRCPKCNKQVSVWTRKDVDDETDERSSIKITLDLVRVVGYVTDGPGEGMPRAVWPFHRCNVTQRVERIVVDDDDETPFYVSFDS